jgi:glycosyltransferase involved in cell wall biosynthesis
MKNATTKPTQLFIEAQRLFRKHKHGMDVVALELLQRLKNVHTSFDKCVLVKQDDDHCLQSNNELAIQALPNAFYPFWEQKLLPKFTGGYSNAVLHCTGNTAPLWSNTPLIVTIHDLIFLESNYLFKKDGGSLYQRFGNVYRSLIVPRVAKKAKHVITVSEFQRQAIMKRFKLLPEKISVVYNGADERFFNILTTAQIQTINTKYGIDNFSYIFFLANTEPRKNTDGVIKAFTAFCKQYPEFTHKLVIKGLTEQQLHKKIIEQGAQEYASRFHRVGYIDYEDLPAVYQGAAMLWFPSFSEGFGLPIIEAMAGGTPVITSKCSVMPEIAGNAALYINPNKPLELVPKTAELLTNLLMKNELTKAGILQAKMFMWDKSMQQLLTVYNKVLTK